MYFQNQLILNHVIYNQFNSIVALIFHLLKTNIMYFIKQMATDIHYLRILRQSFTHDSHEKRWNWLCMSKCTLNLKLYISEV